MARTKMVVSSNNDLENFYGVTSNGRFGVDISDNHILVEYVLDGTTRHHQVLSFDLSMKPRLRGGVPVIDWCEILDKFEEEGVMIGNTPIKDYLSKRRAYWR